MQSTTSGTSVLAWGTYGDQRLKAVTKEGLREAHFIQKEHILKSSRQGQVSTSEDGKSPQIAGVSLVEWREAYSGARGEAGPDPFCMFAGNK